MDDTMNKRPSLQFYPADWRKDPQLQMCSMATQGIWINLLCIMWEAETEGEIAGKEAELIRLIGCTPNDFAEFAEEIKRHNFGDVTICNGDVTIINRRMKRVFLEREGVKERVRQHRKRQSNENVTPYSSSSTSSSSTRHKDFEQFWSLYPKKVGRQYVEKIWAKLTMDADLFGKILSGLENYKRYWEQENTEQRFIPNPSTWLNQKRWGDVLPETTDKKSKQKLWPISGKTCSEQR